MTRTGVIVLLVCAAIAGSACTRTNDGVPIAAGGQDRAARTSETVSPDPRADDPVPGVVSTAPGAGGSILPPGGFERGFGALINAYNTQRVGAGTVAMGIAAGATELSVEWMGTRHQFGRPLAEFQGLQWILADMEIATTTSRSSPSGCARKAYTWTSWPSRQRPRGFAPARHRPTAASATKAGRGVKSRRSSPNCTPFGS